jgi:hypothetical protein
MTETDIQNKIRIALSAYGVVIRQNTGNFLTPDGRRVKCGATGLSDLLFIGDGYIAFIEVKKPGGNIRPEQKNFIRRMHELHHRAGIAYSVDDALRIAGIQTLRTASEETAFPGNVPPCKEGMMPGA